MRVLTMYMMAHYSSTNRMRDTNMWDMSMLSGRNMYTPGSMG